MQTAAQEQSSWHVEPAPPPASVPYGYPPLKIFAPDTARMEPPASPAADIASSAPFSSEAQPNEEADAAFTRNTSAAQAVGPAQLQSRPAFAAGSVGAKPMEVMAKPTAEQADDMKSAPSLSEWGASAVQDIKGAFGAFVLSPWGAPPASGSSAIGSSLIRCTPDSAGQRFPGKAGQSV